MSTTSSDTALPAAELVEDSVEAHIHGQVFRGGPVGPVRSPRRFDQAGGGEVIEGWAGRRWYERAELCDGLAVDRDHHPLAGSGAADHRGDLVAKFANAHPMLVHRGTVARVYTLFDVALRLGLLSCRA